MRTFTQLLVWVIFLAAVSCQRTEEFVQKQTSQEVSVEEGLIKFNTLVDYEKIVKDSASLESLSRMEGFSAASMAPQGGRATAKESVPNATLAKVLNQDNMMQVGKWIVKLNFEQKTVTVINEKDKEKLLSALKNGEQPNGIYTFSFDDDVLYALDESSKSKNGRPALFCCCGINAGQTEDTEYYPHAGGNTAYPMTAYNTYEAYGVYFEASTRIVFKTWPLSLLPDPPFGTITVGYEWTQKCRNPNSEQEATNSYSYAMVPSASNNGQFAFKRLIYASGKGLRQLRLGSRYQMPGLDLLPGEINQ